MAIEQAAYKVILKEGEFEIRQYEPMIVAVSQELDLRGGGGFDTLFAYINGNNEDKKKINMTTPVFNDLGQEHLTIAFVMPKEYSMESLPKPLDLKVQLKEIPGRQVAAIIFSGNVNQVKIDEKKNQLFDWLKEKQINSTGYVELARYNPPFIPGFIKHNELLIEVHLGV
ncbi:MAG: heme-binding protein [Clostridiaceae bacterium]